MSDYIDGFVFPISKDHIDQYQRVASTVATIWKEYGALSYFEYVSENVKMEGIPSFAECLETSENDVIVFGWIVFESRTARDHIHQLIQKDSRMSALVEPIMDPNNLIFNPKKMVFGGFKPLVQ